MFYVYLIRSINFPDQVYVGITEDFKKRLKTHNSGGSVHTAKYRPWDLVVYMGFKNEIKARDFEKYLKSGSGRAFSKKRLW
ncbi:MAG: excinuclease ABC subunit C [Rickettsiales bacterium]|nr:MAG: excinuclease ABC subunit C [Rickettsiales bacterium]